MLSRLSSIPKSHPFAFGVVLSGIKTSASDLLVQKVVERRDEVDWKRNAAFASFGFFYLGGIQYGIYVKLFGRMFPGASSFAAKTLREKLRDMKGMAAMGAQVFLDQCVHHPLMYFPAFYCTKELVMSEEPNLPKVLEEYKANMADDMKALWKVWVPATLVNFSFMPMHARIPFVAGVSLVWTCILSAMRGGDVMHGQDMAGGAVTGATYSILKEGLDDYLARPVELDRHLHHLVLSASGNPGYVAELARAVADEGGNVTHSNMVRLGQEFCMMMHIAVPPQQRKSLLQRLKRHPELKPLDIRISPLTRRGTGTYNEAIMGIRIKCVGQDKPGMLASISEKIAQRQMSIESLSTDLRLSKGKREFVVTAECTTFIEENINDLMQDLSSLKEELDLDTMDIRVHTA